MLSHEAEPWKVTLIDTGQNAMTGGRLKRIQPLVEGADFMMTYGDGVGNIDLAKLRQTHERAKGVATLTATQPSGRFGAIAIAEDSRITSFAEKPKSNWINGGFFVFSPKIFDVLEDDETVLEQEPMRILAEQNQLFAHKHSGFWQPMDTMRDRNVLEELWQTGKAPWKIW